MFEETFVQETQNDEIETNLDEVHTDDSKSIESIKLSSGVEFTQEELEGMDPQILDKLLKVKAGDENFSRGINSKSKRVKELEAELAKLKPGVNVNVKPGTPVTPAPSAGQPQYGITEMYVMKQIARENFEKAKANAAAQYGNEVVNLIGEKLAPLFQDLVEGQAKHDADFNGIYTQAFATMLADKEDRRVFEAFSKFSNGINEDEIKAKAEADAKIQILESKNSSTTGLPAGGAQVVATPAENKRPSNLTEAKIKFREGMAKLKENKK